MLAEIFCEAFLILKTKSVSVMQKNFRFSKWGSLNSIAVRIRVKRVKIIYYLMES
jgi:hypothetical protein